MRGRKQVTYQSYADVYDIHKGDRSATVQLLLELIRKYNPGAQTVLDLACGTGAISEGLPDSFTIFGLDNSPQMLQIAKKKLPHVHFRQGDMAHFRLNTKFDAVYCFHNSVNHLLTLKQLKSTFTCVARHLNEGGLFVFDVNPIRRMEYLQTLGIRSYPAGEDFVISEVSEGEKPYTYTWDLQILLKTDSGYSLEHEPVIVRSFDEYEVAKALQREFEIVDHFEQTNPTIPDEVGIEYYVCTKRTR